MVGKPKVPFVMRMTVTDSGAACLSMVLGFHGKKVALAETRAVMGSSRGGVTVNEISEAAGSFQARGRLVDPLATAEGPLIVRWRHKDFVVVEHRTARYVAIVDPTLGRLRLTADEYAAGVKGPAVLVEPAADYSRDAGRPLPWRRYLKMTLAQPGLLASIFSISLLLRVFGLLFPVLTAFVVDRVIPDRDLPLLGLIGLGLAVFVLVQAGTGLFRQLLFIELGARLDRMVMGDFFQRLMRLPLSFFQIRSGGDILMHVSSNETIRGMLSNRLLGVILDALLVLLYLVLMFAFYAPLAAMVTVLGLLQITLTVTITRILYYYSQRSILAQSVLQGYVVEVLSGMAAIKVAGAEGSALERWDALFTERLAASLSQQRTGSRLQSLFGMLGSASPLLLLTVGAALVIEGELTLGQMLGFNALAASFLGPLGSIGGIVQQLQTIAVHLSRLDDVLEEPPEQDPKHPRKKVRIEGRIEVRGLSFRYGPRDPEALRDIDLEIAPGQTLAIVGPTGSGKSTLAKILAGLYAPTVGEVFYDDTSLDEIDLPSLRRQLGVVLQENFLFQDSIRENITLHDPELSVEAVRRAVAMAEIEDDLADLPLGFETPLGELGNNLSGGQRQRLCLARALAHSPSVLILDEATSHVDALTEARIFDNLAGLDATRIVIAHRLSTIRQADQIVVLDRGRIVERGTHDDLTIGRGLYYRLVTAQETNRPDRG